MDICSFSLSPSVAWNVSFLFLHFLSPLLITNILNGSRFLCNVVVTNAPSLWDHLFRTSFTGSSHAWQVTQSFLEQSGCPSVLLIWPRGHMLWGYQAWKDRACVTCLIKWVFLLRLSTNTSLSLCVLGRGVCHQHIVMLVNTSPVITLSCGLWTIFSSLCTKR